MKIRFRSEKAESAWITAVQMYFAGLILLILFPLFCLLMPTGSVGEFEIKLGLMIGYAAVGMVQTRAVAYTIVDWNHDDAGREVYFFPFNHLSIGKLWDIRR